MNLANLGLTALLAAQHRLQTVGHNINNADTDGYNRQLVQVQSAGGVKDRAGFIGRGVEVVTVSRAYDGFLFGQLVSARSGQASLQAYGAEIEQVANLFADRTTGISPALQQFFDGLQAVASAPADAAARQELLGRAGSLVTQINDADRFLENQRSNLNTQITTVVTQINSMVGRIQNLNQQITLANATSGGHVPNDLLDQRDQVFSELAQLVDVNVFEQDGRFNLTLGNGQVLLGGDRAYPLQAVSSAEDPSRLVVAYTVQSAAGTTRAIEMDEHSLMGGQLGGLLAYRREVLDTVQNALGRLAVGLAQTMNAAHADGHDLAGQPGGEFFGLGAPRILPGPDNDAGTDALAVAIVDANGLTAQDYRLTFDGTDFTLVRLPDGVAQVLDPADPQHDGLAFTLPANAQAGDAWMIQPTRHAAGELSLTLRDPAAIAAAAPGLGRANGDNMLDMAALQTAKLLGGDAFSLNEAFSQIVNRVGVLAQQNQASARAQDSLVDQTLAAQQRVSGVNLDEEYIMLNQFQDQYRAAARMIDVASSLFDTLLSLRS